MADVNTHAAVSIPSTHIMLFQQYERLSRLCGYIKRVMVSYGLIAVGAVGVRDPLYLEYS